MNRLVSRQCTDPPGDKDPTSPALRVAAAGIILLISLLASSFPSLAKRAPRIEPPPIVFFIGKHFGTGVILSTAFVHLLQDGFENLLDPCLGGRWKDWTGFIVLSSFLAIFLIEYISTVYVERISTTSPAANPSKPTFSHEHDHNHIPFVAYRDDPDTEPSPDVEHQGNGDAFTCHIVPIGDQVPDGTGAQPRPSATPRGPYFGHHRHESPHSHHHKAGPRLKDRQNILVSAQQAEEIVRVAHGVHGDCHGEHNHGHDSTQGEVSRRTRIISILVLQLGIMLHSLVLGSTLSITAGSEFTTLIVAILFHQLFEGLSLGIRISTLPSGSPNTRLLPAILCVLFAVTTPIGVLLGSLLLPSASQASASVLSHLQPESFSSVETALLAKGLMCALSAGMLIYAAAVEMLAGDFVMDPEMRQHGFWKQLLGLGSLILGVVAMAIVG